MFISLGCISQSLSELSEQESGTNSSDIQPEESYSPIFRCEDNNVHRVTIVDRPDSDNSTRLSSSTSKLDSCSSSSSQISFTPVAYEVVR